MSWEPEGFATLDAWRAYRRSLERRPAPAEREDCILCEGAGWVEQWDEFLEGYVLGRCPACADLTVRARRGRYQQ